MSLTDPGLLDTSVVIDLEVVDRTKLPDVFGISTLTLAELAAGAHAPKDLRERARRQERLQRAESTYDAIPFDRAAASAYGRVYAAVIDAGRSPKGRVVDLLIAAIALANSLSVVTRNPADFAGLEGLVEIVAV